VATGTNVRLHMRIQATRAMVMRAEMRAEVGRLGGWMVLLHLGSPRCSSSSWAIMPS